MSDNEIEESKEVEDEEEMVVDNGEIKDDDTEVGVNNGETDEKANGGSCLKTQLEAALPERKSQRNEAKREAKKKEEVAGKAKEEESGRKAARDATGSSGSKTSTGSKSRKESETSERRRERNCHSLNGVQEVKGSSSITVTQGGVYQEEEEEEEDVNMIEAKDDREGCRSLICDSNGIIVAEMVYRCMICANISDSIAEAQKHYQVKHILSECTSVNNNGNYTSSQKYFSSLNEESDVDESFSSLATPTVTFNVPSSLKQLQKQINPPPNSTSLLLKKQVPGMSNAAAATAALSKAKTMNGGQGTSRGGYVTCAVCNITKFYASVQRRYGQFTCMGCAKFFGRFLIKPKKYFCPNLGTCPLDTSPRCKACLLLACINTYTIDQERMKIVNANRPAKKSGPAGGTSGTLSITIGQQDSQPVLLPILQL